MPVAFRRESNWAMPAAVCSMVNGREIDWPDCREAQVAVVAAISIPTNKRYGLEGKGAAIANLLSKHPIQPVQKGWAATVCARDTWSVPLDTVQTLGPAQRWWGTIFTPRSVPPTSQRSHHHPGTGTHIIRASQWATLRCSARYFASLNMTMKFKETSLSQYWSTFINVYWYLFSVLCSLFSIRRLRCPPPVS